MKRILLIGLLFVLVFTLSARNNNLKFRFGFLAPEGAKTSIIGGASYGIIFDETVSLDFSADYYHKNYSERRNYNLEELHSGTVVTVNQQTSDISVNYIPLLMNLKINVPLDGYFSPFFGAGVGWGFLWEDAYVAKTDEHDKYDEVDFFNGFNWNLCGGASYSIGSKSSLYGELFYNGGKMTRNHKENEYGRTWEEVDMSGLGLRFGIELKL